MARLLAATERGLHAVGGGPVELGDREVTGLVVEGERRWAIVDGDEIVSSADGQRWTTKAQTDGSFRCLLPTAEGALVGTDGAHLLRLGPSGAEPVVGFDKAPGREEWYTPWGGPPDTRSLSAEAGALYANVHVGGILRSRDGGESWDPTIDVDADVHQVLAGFDGPGHVLAATAAGLAVSHDGGETWTFATDGLHSTYSRAVAVAGETIVVSASSGPRGDRSALYRTAVVGGAFERCRQGLPEWFDANIDTFCLAASGSAVACGTRGGEVFASHDEGVSWEALAAGLPPVRAIGFA